MSRVAGGRVRMSRWLVKEYVRMSIWLVGEYECLGGGPLQNRREGVPGAQGGH
jgi:hypothetical protein